ncbi:MAG: pyrroline-5-carboxylate reductase [Gammaproteobacteria bacterium]|nr:pyrroline-5-carboxylate reductase [Gammaproteobacteria bacterium]
MKNIKTGFIGGGNMARSLIGGLLASGCSADSIHVSDRDLTQLTSIKTDLGVHTHESNQSVVDTCDVIVLAVKPQVMKDVVTALSHDNMADKLLITIAAGIETAAIARWLGVDCAIVRSMPNTPALVKSGATGMFANQHTGESQHEIAESILRAVGLTVWVDKEADIDAITALSGSGPAYLFLVMEAMEQAGIKLGLPAETARLLAVQTAFGASKLALEIEEDPAILRERVTSPGGTTEQALKVFEEGQLLALFEQAMTAARDRARELAQQLGQ